VQIFESLYFPSKASKIVAKKGGMANARYPMGSGSIRLEKYARTIILIPVANAI